MARGTVLALSDEQIVARWLYLVGQRKLDDLDSYIRRDKVTPQTCPAIYYRMYVDIDGKRYAYNGGKDPTAPDPGDRWRFPNATHINVTGDCVAAVMWGVGSDRYQPVRFAHVYGGWINTDAMRIEAAGPARCFQRIDRPEPGAIVVYASDPDRKTHGVKVGHCGGIVGYKLAEWNADDPACWSAIQVANIADYQDGGRANRITTGRGWWAKDSWFLRCVMRP